MDHPPPDPVSVYQQAAFTIDTINLDGIGPSARPEQLHLAIEQGMRGGDTASMPAGRGCRFAGSTSTIPARGSASPWYSGISTAPSPGVT